MKKICLLALAGFLFVQCTSYKHVPYLQDSDLLDYQQEKTELYDAKIMPKDLLVITVNTTDPEAALPFNLTVQNAINISSRSTYSQPALQEYLVNNDGDINFPVLGTLHVSGLTKNECENLIRILLKNHLKEVPVVTVRMSNYKISVLGEVARPGIFTVSNEKVNVFEALAMAGDMTVYGLRENVKLMREDMDGQREIYSIDLTRSDIISSPLFYLQQNDVLYVTPNKTKAKNSDVGNSTTLWFSATSILISLASLLYNILN